MEAGCCLWDRFEINYRVHFPGNERASVSAMLWLTDVLLIVSLLAMLVANSAALWMAISICQSATLVQTEISQAPNEFP